MSLMQLQVSMPASYQKVHNFIKLWQLKAEIAEGRPFKAIEDLNLLTSDIILAAALGIEDSESDTVQTYEKLRTAVLPSPPSSDTNEVYSFPENETDGFLQIILKIGSAIGGAATAPSLKLYWYITNMRPSVRRAKEQRRQILQMHIDRASKRVRQDQSQLHAAVDYMVAREIAAAEKAGRPPVLNSDQMHDMLFGYCLGGQDTTHSVLSFLVKQLGVHQAAQDTLRSHLQDAYTSAASEGRNPTMDEILKTRVPFLDGFIEEVMRLDSAAPVLIKETLEDIVLLGHRVPKGTQIFCTVWGASITEPAYPIDEQIRSETSQKHKEDTPTDWTNSGYPPQEFHPERWLRKDGDETTFNIKAGPTLSFSVGTRECWGKRLAYLELKLVVTLLVWNFKFLPLPAELVDREAIDVLNAKPKRCFVRLQSTSAS
jgi:cytochrome P450